MPSLLRLDPPGVHRRAVSGGPIAGFPGRSAETRREAARAASLRAGTNPASVERVPARAAPLRVRVVDREALLLDRVLEIDRGAIEIRHAHLVDDDLDTRVVDDRVAVEQPLVEVELVDQPGASAGLDCHPQAEIIAPLLFEEVAYLVGGGLAQLHAVRGLGDRVAHVSPRCVRERGTLQPW